MNGSGGGGSAGDRSKTVFEKYSKLHNLSKYEQQDDQERYDMSQRLRLADTVAADGHRIVADLGSMSGGMTHALREDGLVAISTEMVPEFCSGYLKKTNDDATVIRCDSFRLPLKGVDALVSYMFLGLYLPDRRDNGNNKSIGDVFDELSRSSDTVYSVELKSEYEWWFGPDVLTPRELEQKLKEHLPDWDVESLGKFGVFDTDYCDTAERLGFKFTKKNKKREKHGKR